jgi:hypothetical protein
MSASKYAPERGFSLLSVSLVLVGLVAVLTVVIYLLNPLERQREARDKKRFDDMVILDKAVRFYLRNNADQPKLCASCTLGKSVFAPRLISLSETETLIADSDSVSGSGWVPIDFSLNAGLNKTPILVLPSDPKNMDPFVYTFSPGPSGHFKFTATFESKAYQGRLTEDLGTRTDRFEIGTDLSLPPN